MNRTQWTMALLVLVTGTAFGQGRQELSLSGEWEYVKVADLTTPPTEGWTAIHVPGLLSGMDYERAWFRRDFQIPESMRGMRVVLHFGGVKYNSVVRVNGQKVGGYFGGYDPFDVDITAAARFGEANRLELGCCDWTGIFSDRETSFAVTQTRAVDARSIPRDKILAPIGGLWNLYGPWDDVKLRAHPALYVSDLFIKPSWRKKTLRVEYTVRNLTEKAEEVTLGAVVEDQGAEGPALGPQKVSVPAGQETAVVLEVPWSTPRCWSPEDPYLYYLRTRLSRGTEALDELRTRFGFREFWVEGRFFYLNGSRVNLLATSWWPPREAVDKEYIRGQIAAIKGAHCVIFRTHTQPWPEIWYETADEEGLMMIPEGAVWNDDAAYRVNDPVFWSNYAAHLKAMVNREKNRPSVVMYSLENEFYGGRVNDDSPAKAELVKLGEMVRQWDPTRPFMYESDGDPGGVADVVGIHYPHEYPQFTAWPNTAYWMDEPKAGGGLFTNGAPSWQWDRKKPVYVGEFLWVPSSDPSWHTVFFGDDAYLDYTGYRVRAKGESWRMAIQAYRHYEVGGISPWTMVEGGPLEETRNAMYAAQKYAMQPVAAYVKEYDHNFYAGEEITRTLEVYNDQLSPANLVVQWTLLEGDRELHRGEKNLSMEPGERREMEIAETMPLVLERSEVTLRVRVMKAAEMVFEDAKGYSVFPPLRLTAPAGVQIGVYDPNGATQETLERLSVPTVKVDDLKAIPAGVQVVVIGRGVLQPEKSGMPVIGEGGEGGPLVDWVRRGGRVLVLEQTEYPRGLIPASLLKQGSTMTFAQLPDHPLLKGIQASDLKWWRTDNMVTEGEPLRPRSGAWRAVVVSGSQAGLSHAPLLELPIGQGTMVLSQLKVAGKLGVEPVAGRLLQNALDYLAGYAGKPNRTALYCPSAATKEYLDGLGLVYTDITQAPGRCDWAATDLLVACGPLEGLVKEAETVQQIAGHLERGGRVLLHGVTAEDMVDLAPVTGDQVRLVPYQGSVVRMPGAHALSESITNEDLYWLGPQTAANSWATRPRAGDMADFVVAKTLTGTRIGEYQHGQMTVAGTYSSDRENWAALATSGSTATAKVEIPADGMYVIGVQAGGTPTLGIWPAGDVLVDGRLLGAFQCQKGELDTYTVSGKLTAGSHEVTVRFTNDASRPPLEDRNMFVGGIVIAEDNAAGGVALLTQPGALAVVQRGQGQVVLDEVNWDKTDSNAEKALRYISGLLTGLGAPLEATKATVIPVNQWEHAPGMNWYRSEPGWAYLGDRGWIAGKVEGARAGRYQLRLVGRGTPAAGQYPVVEVSVDGKLVGQVEVAGQSTRGYPLSVDLPKGTVEIKLEFVNDLNVEGEDRNLWIERLEAIAE